MYMLKSPRSLIAVDESRTVLEKYQAQWPTEKTEITEWKAAGDKKHSSRRPKRSEDTDRA